ncbi:SDR family NAD(P)-dependent oxidoreductase [Almyronema epifaneia]|uniref:SDR family NAD(P)-dependent oxidoreductase n=1 Tax=Almyronema epifaneia S1 TaxID=2991925 RepID=A0ABW6IGL4_9CYAN
MQVSTQPSKTIIITGATSGLGYHCAETIAKSGQDWYIVIASRNPSTVEAAVQNLITGTEYPHIEGMILDLASLVSVRQFTENFRQAERPPLCAIVCNAGIQIVSDTQYTADGFEMTFGVNHLGHFLLVNLLLPNMSDSSRIVFVSSDTHNPATQTGMPAPQYQAVELLAFPSDNGDGDGGDVGRVRYTTSKLCNVLCAYELSRRLQKQRSPMTVNAFNPGLMLDTKLARDYSQAELSALSAAISPTVLENAKSSQAMGAALARLILDPELENVTGKYFDGLQEVLSSQESYDERKARELWESSKKLVKI